MIHNATTSIIKTKQIKSKKKTTTKQQTKKKQNTGHKWRLMFTLLLLPNKSPNRNKQKNIDIVYIYLLAYYIRKNNKEITLHIKHFIPNLKQSK